MWTLEQALKEIKNFEPKISAIGFHCALTGSVLYRGDSLKDLDLIIYPHKKDNKEITNWQPVMDLAKSHFESAFIKHCGGASQIRDDKKVSWINDKNERRIDLFFLD